MKQAEVVYIDEVHVVIICPFCSKKHFHGSCGGDDWGGSRVPHCFNREEYEISPLKDDFTVVVYRPSRDPNLKDRRTQYLITTVGELQDGDQILLGSRLKTELKRTLSHYKSFSKYSNREWLNISTGKSINLKELE